MKSHKYLAGILFIILPILAYSQKEASVWPLANKKQVNFQSGDFEIKGFELNAIWSASICDKDGNLLLYTDGSTVWNVKNEILINGADLTGGGYLIISDPIFVPSPKKDGHYFLFYVYVTNPNYQLGDKKLVYAEIDCKAGNNRGEVIVKNQFLHNDFHDFPTIAGFCDNKYYWLAIDRNDNIHSPGRDRIFFYRIDENGVNRTPKIDSSIEIGHSAYYKFSPNGSKLFFGYGDLYGSTWRNIVADFNFQTGEIFYLKRLGNDYFTSKEFSGDSKFLYYFLKNKLIQVNVAYSSLNKIENSKTTLLELPVYGESEYNGSSLQLAPDGKIYFQYYDPETNKTKVGRINSPNNKGLSCDVELNIYTFENYSHHFPAFVTSFFRDKEPAYIDKVIPEAGPDIKICSRSSAKIGADGQSQNAFYSWYPDYEILNPFLPEATITAPLLHDESKTTKYNLVATDGNCWMNMDQTVVTFLPQPENINIDGSWSVCPFVEKVDYWNLQEYNDVIWFVNGGEIAEESTNDTVKINWGATNSYASLNGYRTNSYRCMSDTSVFPVRINVELMTETPKGEQHICLSQAKNISYQIKRTNGSVYQWNVEDGKIISGQGTNKILVRWNTEGEHEISVQETSTTIDTICYGESDAINIEIINDSLNIQLNSVSFDNNNNIELNYQSEQFNSAQHQMYALVSDEFGNDTKVKPSIKVYNRAGDEVCSEIIQLKIVNQCDEIFYSNKQQTIALDFETENDKIILDWNNNQFWENNHTEDEVWHSLNQEGNWEKIETLSGANYIFINEGLSLHHYFRIKEKNLDTGDVSWSNIVSIELEDKINIPNVFTPNGDGFNDVWEIENIRFHNFQQLTVFNRYGQKVYNCRNEYVPWDGRIDGRIIQGTYSYQLNIDSGETRYGQITILQ